VVTRLSNRKDPLAHLPHGARASTVVRPFDLSVPHAHGGLDVDLTPDARPISSCDSAREFRWFFPKSANRCAATDLVLRHAWALPLPCNRNLRPKVLFTQPNAGLRLRSVVRELELSEQEAARLLRIDERVFAGWCAGRGKVPRIVWLSLAAIKIRKTWE
jgi:hypothetical protein